MKYLKKPALRITMILLATGVAWILCTVYFYYYSTKRFSEKTATILLVINTIAFIIFIAFLVYNLINNAEKKLTRAASEYYHLFYNNPNPMWIYTSRSFKFIEVNAAALSVYGYTKGEFLSMTLNDIISSEENPWLITNNLVDGNTDPGQNGVWRHKKKNGESFLADIISHNINFKNQKCKIAVSHNLTDILEKENLKNELLNTNRELNNILNSITDCFFIISRDLKIIRANTHFRKLMEIENDDVVGQFLPGLLKKQNRELYNEFKQATETNQSVHFEHYFEEKNRWFRFWIYPFNNGLTVFFRDISVEKEKERIIVQHEQNLEALINNTEDLIWSIDERYNIITYNSSFARVYEQSIGGIVRAGKNVFEDVPEEEAAVWKSYYKRALNGEKFNIEEQFTTGKIIINYSAVSFNPIYGEDQKIKGVGCFLRNVTERRLQEEQIIQQNNKLKEIAFATSHTLRAPLTNILGLATIIEKDKIQDEEQRKIIAYIQASAVELDEVIKNIVVQTQLPSGIVKEAVAEDH